VRLDTENSVDQKDRGNDFQTTYLYLTSGENGNGQTDLAVESMYQDSSTRNIVAHICNRGGAMSTSQSLGIDWQNVTNGQKSTQYIWTQLSSGQCVDASISPWNLNMSQSGYYTINILVDNNNRLNESNRSNNSLSQSIYLGY
jgi:hypothetical protein